MKKRYLYFLPAGIAVVLLTGLFYNRPAADTATPAAAGTEDQRISEEDIETETIEAQSECEISETKTEIFSASSEEYPNYIEAYLEKINECEQESEDLKYDLIYLDEDDFENETYYYYYNDQEITKEEFDSYLINDDYDSIVGSKTASEISSQLQTQEKITQ